MQLIGSYSVALVAMSYLVAVLAAFAALDMAARISASGGIASRWWLGLGGFSMGVGIWSMHFIGMLAFRLPIPQGYDLLVTLYSLLLAIAASTYALYLVSLPLLSPTRLAGGALILGAGIALMHYVGMAAMRMEPGIDYDLFRVGLSIVIAVAAAAAALWIAHFLRREGRGRRVARVLASFVMGFAIVGMHYTGMAAARFPVGSICLAALAGGVAPHWLASLVGIGTFAILGLAIVVSVLDRRLQERTTVLTDSLHSANEKLTHLALHDPLTSLPNRLLLEDRIGQAIEKARRMQSPFALLFVDLDGFKSINDVYGHPTGDRTLEKVADCIRRIVRAQDTVARLGGDEFVLLIEVSQPEEAAIVAEKLLHAISEPLQLPHGELRVTASIGITLHAGDATTAHELLTNADTAMYFAKERGRNGYGFFDVSMNHGAHAQVALVQDLRGAAERGELFLQYQPKTKAPDGPLLGAEALVRWRHPAHGVVMPDDFIPLAEKHGLIIEIGRWVLDEACRQMAQWRRQGHRVAGVAVNLSPTQFRSPGLTAKVRAALQRNDMPAQALTLEITETTAMHDPEASLEILRELVAVGVNISIDDFGTGYSSLMYLKKLPANELKIDRGFIKDLVRGGEDAAIVSAIVALGRTLNLEVVAEGVETREQQLLLTELGCTSLQGFFLGPPVDADALVATAVPATAATRTRSAAAPPIGESKSDIAAFGEPNAG